MSQRPIKLGYALTRVSTPKQALVQHGSLEQQRHMIERWLESQTARSDCDYRIVKYIEEDISGRAASLKKRHGMRELERAIERREIDFFVAEKIDRIGRDQVHNLQLVRKANELGIEVFEVESGQINFRDRGSRMGFNVKNFMAEEYSWDLEEKITKKIREARVNNSKDNQTIPLLGLDPHPTKIGKYVRNDDEVAVVLEIANKFLEAKSYKPVLDYCRKRGYTTKARYTKEKIDAGGNRIPPRRIGGKPYTEDTLRYLLQNDKLRGYSRFKDTWNQFPKLQDAEGFVTWRYEHGAVIDQDLAARIDAVIASFQHTKLRSGKYNDFLLTGILVARDGSRFHGEAARSGAHNYYRNSCNKRRFRCAYLDEIVVARVKCYLDEDGLVEKVYEKSLRASQVGEPSWKQDRTRLQGRVRELETVATNFSRSVREIAASGASGKDMAEIVESLLKEKKTAEAELAAAYEQLRVLGLREEQLKATLQGQTLKLFLKKSMERFDHLPAREQKRVIQSVVMKAVVRDDLSLELTIYPDPANPHVSEEIIATRGTPASARTGRNEEYESSRCAGNGGENVTSSPTLFSNFQPI